MANAQRTTTQGLLQAMSNAGVKAGTPQGSWTPWQGPARPLDPYNSTIGANDTLYRDPTKGDSPWLSMQKNLNSAQTNRGVDQANAQAGNMSAWNQLASHGGVRSGQAMNLAGRSSLAGLTGAQDARFQGADRDMKASIADQEQNLQNQRFDVSNRLNDAQQRNQYNLDKYRDEMQAWAAGQTAAATRAAGKK